MRLRETLRYAVTALALGSIGVLAANHFVPEAQSQTNFIQDGRAGFVVHGFGNAYARPGQIEAMCPDGRSMGYRQIYAESPEGQLREGEDTQTYERRVFGGAMELATQDGMNLCMHPEIGPPDPHHRQMTATNIVAFGIDLDGQNSTSNSRPAPGTCAHDDFIGVSGQRGVDNQMARVVGCEGAGEQYEAEDQTGDIPRGVTGLSDIMLQGAWGILISLHDVESLENDDSVRVGIYSNADPIQLTPSRDAAVPNVTYAADSDQRFRAETTGRIRNGVLTTEPVDVRFHWFPAGRVSERPLNRARLNVRFTSDGLMEGYLAGYTLVEDMYDINYGMRNVRDDNGELVGDRMNGTRVGSNSVMGRTCQGAYRAMYDLADGDFDPETGRCTSLSTQYWLRATPAFVIE